MNILLISYGIKEYDGRLSELYKVAKQMGNVTLVCCGNNLSMVPEENIVEINSKKYLSPRVYVAFVYRCLQAAVKMKNIDILISDNLFAAIPSLLIRKLSNPTHIVQDVRELYSIKDITSKAGRLFCKYEIALMHKADVVMCANEQRADIMQDNYKLEEKPLVFENIRFLDGRFDSEKLDEKYAGYFNYKVNIVSTGGVSVLRTTDKLVYAMSKLPKDYGLFIIGGGASEDKKIIQKIIDKYKLNNVHLIEKIPLAELKYIVRRCDIGIVNYHKRDLNNKYCASGKVYEYLAEGLPIVTTENIPLKIFSEKYNLGAADDDFYNGIIKVSNSIDQYKERVTKYISSISVDKYNSKIANSVLDTLKTKDLN